MLFVSYYSFQRSKRKQSVLHANSKYFNEEVFDIASEDEPSNRINPKIKTPGIGFIAAFKAQALKELQKQQEVSGMSLFTFDDTFNGQPNWLS